jgi:hypothetical protein
MSCSPDRVGPSGEGLPHLRHGATGDLRLRRRARVECLVEATHASPRSIVLICAHLCVGSIACSRDARSRGRLGSHTAQSPPRTEVWHPPRRPRRELPSLCWRRPMRRVLAGAAESGQEPMRQRRAARRRSSLRRRRSSRFSARRWRFSSVAILLSSLLFMVRTCSGPWCPRARCPV